MDKINGVTIGSLNIFTDPDQPTVGYTEFHSHRYQPECLQIVTRFPQFLVE